MNIRIWLLIFLTALAGAHLSAQEAILNFDSRIEVLADSSMVVTETLRVRAMGQEIQRGIYRDFPTLYRGPWGLKARVPFEVLSAEKNGLPEPWRVASESNGVRVYLGNPDIFLSPGEYTYTLRYKTGRQIGFFQDFDELYWNVTGDGWAFPILQARATVDLPPGTPVRSAEAYTGPAGDKGTAWKSVPGPGDATLITTAPLQPGEGFTIAVTWPKGFVKQPEGHAGWLRMLADNPGIFLGMGGMLAAFAYYFGVWLSFGKDPEKGVIVPLYRPPEGFGPAAVRYLRDIGKFDDRSLSATVLDLAVRGALRIEQEGDSYVLERTPGPTTVVPPGSSVITEFFGRGNGPLEVKQSNHQFFSNAKKELRKFVAAQCDSVYFVKNTGLWAVGLGVTLIPMALSLFGAADPGAAVFLCVWLGIWSLGVAFLSMQVVAGWKASGWKKIAAIPLTLFAIPFWLGWFFGAGALVMVASPWVAGCYVAGIGMTVLFHHLLKRPTEDGRRIMDEIEGFREYLAVAESDRLNLENPPEKTPQLFERFLPYALALDVEQQWSEKFTDVLASSSYQPNWYAGPALTTAGFAGVAGSMAGSFSSAISSSSTAPGSSSGSGGGGSSGGGGGGGGGGGW